MTSAALHRAAFRAMASDCDITLAYSPQQGRAWAEQQAQRAIHEIRRIEAKYSRYQSDSLVSRINAAAGQSPVPIDPETRQLFDFADRMHQQSGGLFDLTSGVLRRAWNFQAAQCPSAAQLDTQRPLVGWSRVQRQASSVYLPTPGMEIDLGGIGKEYAADRAAAVLRQHGVQHALINLGGDLVSIGPKPDASPWTVGIRHPRQAGQIIATLSLSGQALATSGDYERYFEQGGQRYCHILNPHTGWPVQHFQSVSVTAPSCLLAGAISTLLMLQQSQATPQVIQSLGLPVLWVDAAGQIHAHTA